MNPERQPLDFGNQVVPGDLSQQKQLQSCSKVGTVSSGVRNQVDDEEMMIEIIHYSFKKLGCEEQKRESIKMEDK